jgi:hypothetical protein
MEPLVQELIDQSKLLLEMSEKEPGRFKDYSFVVFPAAKAYEGFLKKIFFDAGFITESDYLGNRWRVGKALNPFLEKEIRYESVYDKIVSRCGGNELADALWETWKTCRNLVFHFFPKEKNIVSLDGARQKLEMITAAITKAIKECPH